MNRLIAPIGYKRSKDEMFLDSQYNSSTDEIVDFENDEEAVGYSLVEDNEIMLAMRHVLKAPNRPPMLESERWIYTMNVDTFNSLNKAVESMFADIEKRNGAIGG